MPDLSSQPAGIGVPDSRFFDNRISPLFGWYWNPGRIIAITAAIKILVDSRNVWLQFVILCTCTGTVTLTDKK